MDFESSGSIQSAHAFPEVGQELSIEVNKLFKTVI